MKKKEPIDIYKPHLHSLIHLHYHYYFLKNDRETSSNCGSVLPFSAFHLQTNPNPTLIQQQNSKLLLTTKINKKVNINRIYRMGDHITCCFSIFVILLHYGQNSIDYTSLRFLQVSNQLEPLEIT